MNIIPPFSFYKAILVPYIAFLLSISYLSGAQEYFEHLVVGGKSYQNALVKQVTPLALIIQHDQGIARIALQDLPSEFQAHFNYDPKAAADYKKQLLVQNEKKRSTAKATLERHLTHRSRARQYQTSNSAAERVLSKFGTPPDIQQEVDFRLFLKEMELHPNSQGLRPSCSVFAIVSAFEYQKAVIDHKSEKLSEEFLIWATRQTLGMNALQKDRAENEDIGFTLTEVAQALQTYGIPLDSDMPYSFKGTEALQSPAQSVLAKAREGLGAITVYRIIGRDTATQLDNIIHALNEGVPLAIGLRWPANSRQLWKNPLINNQQPPEEAYHAVTLVGYKTSTGSKQDLLFIFKNSWGPRWGANGYGYVSYSYLEKYLRTALFISYH